MRVQLATINGNGGSSCETSSGNTQAVLDAPQRALLVQLIHPPQRIAPTNIVSSIAIPPLGLAYLAASLENAGHRVAVVDAIGGDLENVYNYNHFTLRGMALDDIVERIDPDADVIGLGIMFSCAWPVLRDLVARIKQRYPDKPLILGGEHPTAMVDLCFEQSPCDYIALGEGEETLLEFCIRLARGDDVRSVAGLAYRSPNGVHTNERRKRIRDIDAIPLPAWHHFDVPRYIAYGQPHGSADGASMPMLATRGCPFQCTFCGSPGMWGTTWRARDPKKVCDEIESYMQRYGATDFHFEDLTAVVRKDWVLAFARELLDRGLKISWQLPSGTRSEAIDEEVARAMYASGCRQFTYALESGSEDILKRIKKRIHLDAAFKSARSAMRAGIRVQCVFILGFPGETWRQMAQTYRTILKCAWRGFHECTVCAFQPLPNTELFAEIDAEKPLAVTDAYLDSIFGYLGVWNQKSWNPRVSDVLLRVMILACFASFFTLSYVRRPQRLIGLLKGVFTAQSGGKFARVLKGMFRTARDSRRMRSSQPATAPEPVAQA
ncbi:MAG: B12-binding domain-containing radical SAM protein [Phycisphaerales bacterium]|nr:B12-binding domain-containing radical SAM protein [Phycisphaerales bacterium]